MKLLAIFIFLVLEVNSLINKILAKDKDAFDIKWKLVSLLIFNALFVQATIEFLKGNK